MFSHESEEHHLTIKYSRALNIKSSSKSNASYRCISLTHFGIHPLALFLSTINSLKAEGKKQTSSHHQINQHLQNLLNSANKKQSVMRPHPLGGFFCWGCNEFLFFHGVKPQVADLIASRNAIPWGLVFLVLLKLNPTLTIAKKD